LLSSSTFAFSVRNPATRRPDIDACEEHRLRCARATMLQCACAEQSKSSRQQRNFVILPKTIKESLRDYEHRY
jgi:hypothetical protein